MSDNGNRVGFPHGFGFNRVLKEKCGFGQPQIDWVLLVVEERK
jgi:hypothetical protein